MLLSKACEYGLKACIFLASAKPSIKTSALEISEVMDAPSPFTAKILKQLSKAGIISSNKGPKGGFYLTNEQQKQNLYTVLVAIDGDQLFTGCALGLSTCSSQFPCPVHKEYALIRDRLTKLMKYNTLDKMADSYQNGEAFLKSLEISV